MRILWGLLTAILVVGMRAATCPDGWIEKTCCNRVAPSCYKKITIPREWDYKLFSENYCATFHKDAFFASIHCHEENEFIHKQVANGTKYAVIGLHIPKPGKWARNNFVWADGTTLDYKNYAGDDPDNKNLGEHYTYMYNLDGANWRDNTIAGASVGICKIDFTRKGIKPVFPCASGFKLATSCGLPACMAMVEEPAGYQKDTYCRTYHPKALRVTNPKCDDEIAFINDWSWKPIATYYAYHGVRNWTMALCRDFSFQNSADTVSANKAGCP